jgi:hypothetical protein
MSTADNRTIGDLGDPIVEYSVDRAAIIGRIVSRALLCAGGLAMIAYGVFWGAGVGAGLSCIWGGVAVVVGLSLAVRWAFRLGRGQTVALHELGFTFEEAKLVQCHLWGDVVSVVRHRLRISVNAMPTASEKSLRILLQNGRTLEVDESVEGLDSLAEEMTQLWIRGRGIADPRSAHYPGRRSPVVCEGRGESGADGG